MYSITFWSQTDCFALKENRCFLFWVLFTGYWCPTGDWNTWRTKVNLKLKINNCFTIISISNLNAKPSVLCSNTLYCVLLYFALVQQFLIKAGYCKIFKFEYQTIPNAKSSLSLYFVSLHTNFPYKGRNVRYHVPIFVPNN